MSSKKKLITNYLYNTAYQLLVLLAPLVTTPYVSRILGASGVGIYNYAQSIATYFVYIGIVGTLIYGQREIAYTHDDPVRRSEIFWEIIVIKLVAVVLCTAVYLPAFCRGGDYAPVFRILTMEVAATAFDISWFFMGLQNFRLTVIRNTIVKLLGIVMVFIFVKKPEDVGIYTACMTVPILIGNLSLWISLPKYLVRVRITGRGVLRHLRPTFILFVPQLATEAYLLLDKTMLGTLATNIDEVGYYSQASKIVRIVVLLVTSLGTVMLPAMSEAFAKGQYEEIGRNIRKAFRFVFMLGFALLFGLCGVADNFVPLFFGPGYEPVAPLMMIISPILILIAASNVIGKQFLIPTKQERAYTLSVVGGACVNFVCNLVLIPRFNAYGASVATVIAELAVTTIQAVYVRKQLKVLQCMASGLRYLGLGLIMGAAVYGTGRALPAGTPALLVQIAVGMAVYAALLVLTKDALLKEGLELISKKRKKR